MKGTVKWFNEEKGFGFITGEDGKDVFVHFSQINKNGFKTLKENEEVEYSVTKSVRGMQAENIIHHNPSKTLPEFLFYPEYPGQMQSDLQ